MSKISETTLKRLPQYLQLLKKYNTEDKAFASASVMSELLRIHHTQIRKDFDQMGIRGFPKKGHPVKESIDKIEIFLGWKKNNAAFLIGAGNLGRALMGYADLRSSGIKIEGAFDVSKELIGKKINHIEIHSIEDFTTLVKKKSIKIAILTAPAGKAGYLKELILQTDIKAVWNFMPEVLDFPEGIVVENADIFSSLAVLSHKLKGINKIL